jgi:hypothetical protein
VSVRGDDGLDYRDPRPGSLLWGLRFKAPTLAELRIATPARLSDLRLRELAVRTASVLGLTGRLVGGPRFGRMGFRGTVRPAAAFDFLLEAPPPADLLGGPDAN